MKNGDEQDDSFFIADTRCESASEEWHLSARGSGWRSPVRWYVAAVWQECLAAASQLAGDALDLASPAPVLGLRLRFR